MPLCRSLLPNIPLNRLACLPQILGPPPVLLRGTGVPRGPQLPPRLLLLAL